MDICEFQRMVQQKTFINCAMLDGMARPTPLGYTRVPTNRKGGQAKIFVISCAMLDGMRESNSVLREATIGSYWISDPSIRHNIQLIKYLPCSPLPKSMKLSLFLSIVSSLTFHARFVEAGPLGAGGCYGGIAAVYGSHVLRNATVNGTLADGGFSLFVKDVQVDSSNEVALDLSTTHPIYVSGEKLYKGVLYRLEAEDGSDMTGIIELSEGDTNTKLADDVCLVPVAGVTHANANEKNDVPATLNTGDEPAVYLLDVTIVVSNTADMSEYYYTRYTLSVESSDHSPSESGEEVPAPSPTAPSPAASSGGISNTEMPSVGTFVCFAMTVFVSSQFF
jgi:hypothetical protein